jgi:hypothetical protein
MGALLALGCAVCGAGEDAARGSYVGMTLIISALPLVMLGGIIWFVVRATRANERASELARAAAAAEAEPRDRA